ncbi:hypothetical protein pb186bvf_004615 [Paramecium bursaria]
MLLSIKLIYQQSIIYYISQFMKSFHMVLCNFAGFLANSIDI